MNKKVVATLVAGTVLAVGSASAIQVTPCTNSFVIRDLSANQSISVREQMRGKTLYERATLKAKAISSSARAGEFNRSDYCLDIEGIQEIEGGVEVFLRAWKNGKPVGFGTDGTVEIERFRIFNPPVLVPDPNGLIVQQWTDPFNGNLYERRLREDPEEALLQVLEHNLRIMKNAHGPENIQPGKRGNTTSTFYPQPSPGSTTFDGYVQNQAAGYSTTQGATTGTATSDTATFLFIQQFNIDGSNFRIVRSGALFDTSPIGDSDTISSATLSLYGQSVNADADNDKVNIYSFSPASTTAMATGDFDAFGTTPLSTEIDVGSFSVSGYNNYTLNASGLAQVSKVGVSKFGIRLTRDVSATQPTGNTDVRPYSADNTGTTNDPKLVVEHTTPSASIESELILFE